MQVHQTDQKAESFVGPMTPVFWGCLCNTPTEVDTYGRNYSVSLR